jgi:hypothetical protein
MLTISKMPRQVSVGGKRLQKLVYNLNDLKDFIDKYDGIDNLYISLYSFSHVNGIIDYQSANIDCVFFDFDIKDEKYKIEFISEVNILVEWCLKHNICFSATFSGKGIHILLYTKISALNNKKQALLGFQTMLTEMLQLKIIKKDDETYGLDRSPFGDTSRIIRLINTKNKRTGLYCIPITVDELKGGEYDNLKLIAGHRRNFSKENAGKYLYGKKLIDLEPYDGMEMRNNDCMVETPKESAQVNFQQYSAIISDIPCIKAVVENPEADHVERTLVLAHLKLLGFTAKEADQILHSFISEEYFAKSKDAYRHAQDYFKYNYSFPSCQYLASKGLCPLEKHQKDCKFYNKISLIETKDI